MTSRSENMKKQGLKGAFVNKQKGLLKFIKYQTKKTDIIHNEIIDELLENFQNACNYILSFWLSF